MSVAGTFEDTRGTGFHRWLVGKSPPLVSIDCMGFAWGHWRENGLSLVVTSFQTCQRVLCLNSAANTLKLQLSKSNCVWRMYVVNDHRTLYLIYVVYVRMPLYHSCDMARRLDFAQRERERDRERERERSRQRSPAGNWKIISTNTVG